MTPESMELSEKHRPTRREMVRTIQHIAIQPPSEQFYSKRAVEAI